MSELTELNKFKLGFGLMRLPRLKDDTIDLEQTCRMVDAFLAAGGTYFDTAFVYNGSEEAARKALVERHPRENYTIATKLNARVAKSEEDAKQQFTTSLKRLGVDYVDFYLLHAMGSGNLETYEKYHAWEFMREKKEQGLVRHIGFSFHDKPEVLDRILTAHPEAEFVQIQLNYADWESPEVQSRAVYEVARRHGKAVVVMEPVKGGALADPPQSVKDIFAAADAGASCASWAVRFASSLDGMLAVLSGMSTIEQVEDNVSYMKAFQPLTEAEQTVIAKAQAALAAIDTIQCTACRYCVEGCPNNIPIPDIFKVRNHQLLFHQEQRAKRDYAWQTENKGKASDCIQCGQCEGACPQHLPIIELLEQCAEALE